MAWAKLGTNTLTTVNADITVSSISDNKFIIFLIHTLGKSTMANDDGFRLGYGSVDTGANYSHRNSINGVADVTGTSQTKINQVLGGANAPLFRIGYIINISNQEKLVIHHHIEQNTAGAGTAPVRFESVGKWVNTSNVIDSVTQFSGGSATFNTDSNVSVIGTTGYEVLYKIQNGTVFEETDTNKSYIFNSSTGAWTQI